MRPPSLPKKDGHTQRCWSTAKRRRRTTGYFSDAHSLNGRGPGATCKSRRCRALSGWKGQINGETASQQKAHHRRGRSPTDSRDNQSTPGHKRKDPDENQQESQTSEAHDMTRTAADRRREFEQSVAGNGRSEIIGPCFRAALLAVVMVLLMILFS